MNICNKCQIESEKIYPDLLCKKCHVYRIKHESYLRCKKAKQESKNELIFKQILQKKELVEKPEIIQQVVEEPKKVLTERQIKDAKRYRENKELKNQQAREYYEKNRDKIRAQRAEFHLKNPNNRKEQQKKRREKPDIKFELTLRRRARRCLIHGPRCMEYLGCSIDFLKEWFKFQFNLIDENMTLENHGSYWEIDHVKPVSSFDLKNEDDVKKCFHWTNVSPLEKSLNKKKSDNYTQEILDIHKQRVTMFLEHYNKNNLFNINEALDTARL
jgi:hypothetical protein